VLLGSLWVIDRIARTPMATGIQALGDSAHLRRVLPELPDDALLREWGDSADLLGPDVDPATRVAAAELRALLIDELSRRDPAGVERWLRTGDSRPDQHLPRSGPG
jgi:hypothetical protein